MSLALLGSKVGHQLVSLALPHCLGMPYWHYQLVLSLYLHQPESHQFSLQKGVGVTQLQRTGPIDRTPGTPGSDKKINLSLAKHVSLIMLFISQK